MALSLLDQFGGSQAQARQDLAGAQRRLSDLQRKPFQLKQPSGLMASPQDFAAFNAQRNAMTGARNDVYDAEANIQYQDPSRNPQAAFQRILGTSEDFYNQQSGESPMDKMLREQLMQRVSGQQQPYDATTINALKTGANEQAAQAQMVNNQRAQASLEERGFKPGDPGYQAAMQKNQLARQQANQQAALGINQQSNLANYNARGQALSQAGQMQNDQYQRQAGALDRLQRNYNQVSNRDLGTAPQFRVPSYSDYMRKQ